jgi:hypothetical protein
VTCQDLVAQAHWLCVRLARLRPQRVEAISSEHFGMIDIASPPPAAPLLLLLDGGREDLQWLKSDHTKDLALARRRARRGASPPYSTYPLLLTAASLEILIMNVFMHAYVHKSVCARERVSVSVCACDRVRVCACAFAHDCANAPVCPWACAIVCRWWECEPCGAMTADANWNMQSCSRICSLPAVWQGQTIEEGTEDEDEEESSLDC